MELELSDRPSRFLRQRASQKPRRSVFGEWVRGWGKMSGRGMLSSVLLEESGRFCFGVDGGLVEVIESSSSRENFTDASNF